MFRGRRSHVYAEERKDTDGSAKCRNRRMDKPLLFAIPFLLLAFPSPASDCKAQDVAPELAKSVWLYKLSVYSDWPANAAANAGGNFVIGVLGKNPYGDHLKKIAAKKIQGKKVIIQEFPSVTDYKSCHVLLVSQDDAPGSKERGVRARLEGILPKVAGESVLLVSDSPGLIDLGSMVNFVIGADGLLYLEVKVASAKAVQIDIKGDFLRSTSVLRR